MRYDIIIKNACLITMNNQQEIITAGWLLVRGNQIAELGSGELPAGLTANKIIDAAGNIVLPGFINTHTHAAMTIFRGYADDIPLMEWLNDYIWPAEERFVTALNVRLGTQLACIEMIKSGITTFNDMYFFEGEVAEAARETGMRAMLGEAFLDIPVPINRISPEYHLELVKKYQHDELIHPAVVAHAPYSCTKEILLYAKELSDQYKIPLHIHLSESDFEVSQFQQQHGMTPVEYLDNLTVLNQRTVAVHCVKLTEKDIEIFKRRGVGVSHNPKSNLKLANGFAPLPELIAKGIKTGLGTDGAASNNSLNMYEEIGFAARMHKGNTQNPTVANAQQILKMATIGGAEVLGLDQITGSLEIGKRADIQIVDVHKPHLTPMYNPVSHLAYAVTAADVDTVIINGRVVMENRRILTIDEKKVLLEVNQLAKQIAST